jgi:hypothetical protein
MLVEESHQFFRAVAHDPEAIDEFLVAVAQEGAHVREAVLEMGKNRAAAKKRLEVAVDLVREKLLKLAEQTRLAARPFQKRLGFQPFRHDKRHGHLFVVELAIAFRGME